MKTVYLVSCVSKKGNDPCAAEELYCSEWFKKAREYVSRHLRSGDEWYILSARHGLLRPLKVIKPYNETLNGMGKAQRRAWADRVVAELQTVVATDDSVIFLAGIKYREFLEPAVKKIGCMISVPMDGMPIGKQLQWLGNQLQLHAGALRR